MRYFKRDLIKLIVCFVFISACLTSNKKKLCSLEIKNSTFFGNSDLSKQIFDSHSPQILRIEGIQPMLISKCTESYSPFTNPICP